MLPNQKPTVNALLKTAQKAFENQNYKRELELVEQAVQLDQNQTVLQRYLSSLYRNGEYRTVHYLLNLSTSKNKLSEDFLQRMKELLAAHHMENFENSIKSIKGL